MAEESSSSCAVAAKLAQGIHIEDRWRSNRKGYKAGAMMEAEKATEEYEYTAIFDADFKPSPDFLLQTVPYLLVRTSRATAPVPMAHYQFQRCSIGSVNDATGLG